jgi:hypothetical protein
VSLLLFLAVKRNVEVVITARDLRQSGNLDGGEFGNKVIVDVLFI